MWYEIIPSAAIVGALLAVPPYASWVINKLITGRSSVRDWDTNPIDGSYYLRDRRIAGSEYKPKGLETIPDEE